MGKEKGNAKLVKDKVLKNSYELYVNGKYIGKVFTNPEHICLLTDNKKIIVSVESSIPPTQKSGNWYQFDRKE
jgi:uncharacterized protein YlzI (FlbEa/FlbD family)